VRPAAALAALLAFAAGALAGEVRLADLPREARETLQLIEKGGPYPYAQDGRTFRNRERLLPPRERGYYAEYTVRTPGVRGRGARRLVAGRGGELYYTADHYRSFSRIMRE
jgi:ribonuclease T1